MKLLETPQVQNVTSDDYQHIKVPNGSSEVVLPSSPIFSEESDIQGIIVCDEVNSKVY